MSEYTIPNTINNRAKVREAVAEYMVDQCLTVSEIRELAKEHLVETYAIAKHTIGDLARMVSETGERALYFGSYPNTNPTNGYYFFTRERSPEYSTLEVRKAD
jgi:hypothetical protein